MFISEDRQHCYLYTVSDDDSESTGKITSENRMAEFTDKQKEDMFNLAERFSNRPVFAALAEFVKDFAPATVKEALLHEIHSYIKYPNQGHVEMSFNEPEYDGYKLRVSLSLAPKDYITTVDIPGNYANDLYSKYIMLKQMATTYWKAMLLQPDIAELIKKINFMIPGEPIGELIIDSKHQTSMYFRADSSYRVSIYCHYVDPSGRPLYKSQNSTK